MENGNKHNKQKFLLILNGTCFLPIVLLKENFGNNDNFSLFTVSDKSIFTI